MLIVHLPVRIAYLVADLPVHDWHHLAHVAGQSARHWPQSLYMREIAIANGDRPGFSDRELWGMRNMIEHQFNWLESIVCQYLPPADVSLLSKDGIITPPDELLTSETLATITVVCTAIEKS